MQVITDIKLCNYVHTYNRIVATTIISQFITFLRLKTFKTKNFQEANFNAIESALINLKFDFLKD